MPRLGLLPATIAFLILLVFIVMLGIIGINKEKEIADLMYTVPSVDMYTTTASQLSIKELEQLNGFFTKIKEFTGVDRKSNPITLTGEEFNRIPTSQRNVGIPKSVKLFRSGFYNSAGYTLESQSGIFASQAILYGNKADADLAEKNLMKMTRKHYSVVYRKGNVVGSTNMYRPGEPTKELFELVAFVEKHGFHTTVVDGRTAKDWKTLRI